MATKASYGSLTFAEQISFFRSKLNLPSERWNDIWRSAHNTSFAVAGAMKADLLNDFRQALDSAISEGKSLIWFKSEFKHIAAKHGWQHTGGADWRARIIYNTNMRQSYNAGRFEQLQKFDYWRYAHGDSQTPRELHLKWHNILLPKDDPWWQNHFPSNGWGCKCRVYGVSKNEFERRGLRLSERPNDGLRDWLDKTTGEVHQIPKGIDAGFDYQPKREVIAAKRKQQTEAKIQNKAKRKAEQATERIVPDSFSTVKGVTNASLNQALNVIKQTSSAEQVDLLGKFMQQYKIKSLFLKQAEMGASNAGAKAIEQSVAEYLKNDHFRTRRLYTTNGYRRAWGFTSSSYDNVNVKVASTIRLDKMVVNELRQGVKLAAMFNAEQKTVFSMSALIRSQSVSAHHGGTLVTWLHEVGHQLHFKAGSPPRPMAKHLTRYSNSNYYEWHAEHFTAWVLNRNALAEFSPEIAEYFDKLIVGVLAKEPK
ncbi:phage minor head protein [Shewanella sp. 1CM18E]|uniref:phage minor head protein n=1 Tax=Shewanella sp. 1CM18E TaxID=2929169 RepID=UPI0020BF15EC|nr:phage minor head protein [Shewanella sp. 1CM18E]MCK8043932.1 phage minor head protein [Shewanella sp. 1CM18E]